MRKNYVVICGLGMLVWFFSSCAPQLSVASCTSQIHYPGQQEIKPYQEVKILLDSTYTDVSIDSLHYGGQTLQLTKSGSEDAFLGKAAGTGFSGTATLYYSRKSKVDSVSIESIQKLDPLYLP